MENVNLVVYGVFDKAVDSCVMVGSTVHWPERIKGYKRYKWYSPETHEHQVLWEGSAANDEFLHGLRATKEAAWIGRMKTWSAEGGRNQMNPVAWYLGNPELWQGMYGDGNPAKRPEVRVKMSVAANKDERQRLMRSNNPGKNGAVWLGRSHSEETRLQMSEAHLALPPEKWDYMHGEGNPTKRPEVVEKIQRNRRKPTTEEARQSQLRRDPETFRHSLGDKNAMKSPEVKVKMVHVRNHLNKMKWDPTCRLCFEVD